MTTSTASPGPAGQSRSLAGLSEKLHPASSWVMVTRTRMPATVPLTWCLRLAPHASFGSNSTGTRAFFPGNGWSVVVYARARSTDDTGTSLAPAPDANSLAPRKHRERPASGQELLRLGWSGQGKPPYVQVRNR